MARPKASPKVTKESLKAMAELSGIRLSAAKLEALLPQVQRNAEATASLDDLELENVEPAVVFRADKS